MKELDEHDLFYRPWKPDFKNLAARRYQYLQAEHPELIEEVLSDHERWLVGDYLLSKERPSQREMAARIGWGPHWINVRTRFALIKLERALRGEWPPERREIRADTPEILFSGPGFGKDGKRTGEVDLSGEEWEDFNRLRKLVMGEWEEEN